VRHHVAAKRYLCTARPDYLKRLSTASIHSLNLQGGPMSKAEAAAFELNPHLKEIIRVRQFDDAGKRAALETPPFSHYAPMIERLVAEHALGADRASTSGPDHAAT